MFFSIKSSSDLKLGHIVSKIRSRGQILENHVYILEVTVLIKCWGWSAGAKVLGKLSVLGRHTSLDDSRARAYCALAVGAGGGCLDILSLIYLFSFLSPSLWETARYRLKYCLKGPLNPKQPTNQPLIKCSKYMSKCMSP